MTPKHATQFQLDGAESDIEIAGIGDAIFQETILVQADQRSGHGDVIFVDTNNQEGIGVADPTDVDAWLQPLATSFGSITGSPEYENGSGLSTSLGTLIVGGVQDVSFQETVAPEPATSILAAVAFLAAAAAKRRPRLRAE